jgi:hypothetical protein
MTATGSCADAVVIRWPKQLGATAAQNASLFFSTFPMLVPSLSWQNHLFFLA